MKKTYSPSSYIEMYYKTQNKYINLKRSEAGAGFMTEEDFKKRIHAEAVMKYGENYTTEQVKKAITSYLNTKVYKSTAELMHTNLMKKLKEEGVVSRIYRMGGKTSMEATSYTKKLDDGEGILEGYHSNGFYRLGSIIVKFWSSDDKSEVGYLEIIPMQGESYIKEIRGTKV